MKWYAKWNFLDLFDTRLYGQDSGASVQKGQYENVDVKIKQKCVFLKNYFIFLSRHSYCLYYPKNDQN